MPRLLSVNVGLPRDLQWNGRTVHTGIWKSPLQGRCRARRLNLDGDGQGDLAGHGGEHRAVFVYQIESLRHWQQQLQWTGFDYGQLGENFTIEGLADGDVCIGDRYRIGDAVFEVTQPRVTCYRVGIRTGEPRMAALLTASGRPGFYFRVLQEGSVGAGDEIVKVGEAHERMTITEINALLYSADHPRGLLERALRIEALSSGWRHAFEALLRAGDSAAASGNAGLAPVSASHPAASGFQRLTVRSVTRESADVLSFDLRRADGLGLPMALAGQYVVLRLPPAAGQAALYRSYSLSGAPSTQAYRISVKLEPDGVAGAYLHRRLQAGDAIDVSAPRGSFVLSQRKAPVVLLSAGIGVTPVLAMLHALSEQRTMQPVWWLHVARDGRHHPFDAEARELLASLTHGRRLICFSRPASDDRPGAHYDTAGRLTEAMLAAANMPPEAEVYVCGPARFMDDAKVALANLGFGAEHVHTETFRGADALNPGIVNPSTRAPHRPDADPETGFLVSFARSGVAAHWNPAACRSLLELAEACDVPVRWACRAGVCHNCESGLVSGAVAYDPAPLDAPANGNLLICCSQPLQDVVLDL
jgi:ferredoxin-NADP reductase/MOSC domain-containing protein YiiM/ferredoxin